jgi:hypothetical protein
MSIGILHLKGSQNRHSLRTVRGIPGRTGAPRCMNPLLLATSRPRNHGYYEEFDPSALARSMALDGP